MGVGIGMGVGRGFYLGFVCTRNVPVYPSFLQFRIPRFLLKAQPDVSIIGE